MTADRQGGDPPHPESLRALLARGGRPSDLPVADLLIDVALHHRGDAREPTLAYARAALAALPELLSPEEEARALIHHWIIELLAHDEVATWLLAGRIVELGPPSHLEPMRLS